MKLTSLKVTNYLHGDIDFKLPNTSKLIAIVNGRNGNKAGEIFLLLRSLAGSMELPKQYAKRSHLPTQIVITLEHDETITTYSLSIKGDKVRDEVVTIGTKVTKLQESGTSALNVLSVESRRDKSLENVQLFFDGLALASVQSTSVAMMAMPSEKIRNILENASLLTEEIESGGVYISSKDGDIFVRLSGGVYVSTKSTWYFTQATQRALVLSTLLNSAAPLIIMDMRGRDIGKPEYDAMTVTDKQVVVINCGLNSLCNLNSDEAHLVIGGIKGNRMKSLSTLIPSVESSKDLITAFTDYCQSVLLQEYDRV